MQMRCSSTAVDPGYQYVDVGRGTSGSYHAKDAHFKTAEMPTATMSMPCTKKNLLFFAEHALHGQPQATLAGSGLTIANDGGSYIGLLVLNGVRPHINTADNWKIYVSVTDGGGGTGHTINLYSDASRSALIATGSGNNSAAITITESNSSGLSGTMTFGTVSGSDTDIEVTIAAVTVVRSGTIDRFFTMWRDSGKELERVIDCTVASLSRTSQEMGPVMLDVELVGSTHNAALSTAFTATLTSDDKDVYLHDSVIYTSDVDSDAVTESVFRVDINLANSVEVDMHNASNASAIWKKNVEDLTVEMEQRFADEAKAIITSGLADTFTSERVVDTHDSKTATWLFDKAKPIDIKLPETDEEEWSRSVITFACREETAATPAAPFSLVVQGP
jgi:hypothetical protein